MANKFIALFSFIPRYLQAWFKMGLQSFKINLKCKFSKDFSVFNEDLQKNSFLDLGQYSSDKIPQLKNELEELNKNYQPDAHKTFNAYDNLLSGQNVSCDSIMFKIALDKNILGLVSSYFNEPPTLHGIRLLKSTRHSNNGWDRDQLWHRDRYAKKQLRLFIYISSCTLQNGPFQYIRKTLKSQCITFFNQFFRFTDSFLNRCQLDKEVQFITGEQGKTFLIDVGRLSHCGSRVFNGERFAFSVIYTNKYPYVPIDNMINEKKSQLKKLYSLPIQKGALS